VGGGARAVTPTRGGAPTPGAGNGAAMPPAAGTPGREGRIAPTMGGGIPAPKPGRGAPGMPFVTGGCNADPGAGNPRGNAATGAGSAATG